MSAYRLGLEHIVLRTVGSLFLAMDSKMMLELNPQVIGESLFGNRLFSIW